MQSSQNLCMSLVPQPTKNKSKTATNPPKSRKQNTNTKQNNTNTKTEKHNTVSMCVAKTLTSTLGQASLFLQTPLPTPKSTSSSKWQAEAWIRSVIQEVSAAGAMNRTKGQSLIFKTCWPQGRGWLGVEHIRWVGGGENDSMHHRTSWLQGTLSHSVANTHLLHGNSKASLVGGVASFHGVLVKHTQTHPSHGHGFPGLCRIFIHFIVRPFPAPVLGLVESAAGPWHTFYLKRSTHVSPETFNTRFTTNRSSTCFTTNSSWCNYLTVPHI